MATFISHSADETAQLGERWGRSADAGTILGLAGDLGSGKTQFVIGLARGLGVKERVQSPTFALVHQYGSGRLPLAHLDLYRLETAEQIRGAGLDEFFYDPPGVVVVEWCDRWPGFEAGANSSPRFHRVTFEETDLHSRRISYDDPGA
jgi:tRNA threonylcarbamoyladenosine biosynthesis protein TsaE